MRRYSMEITIGLILIAILFLVAAIFWIIKIEAPKRASERYVNELGAVAKVMASPNARPVVSGSSVYLPQVVDGDFTWKIEAVKIGSGIQSQSGDIDMDSIRLHDDCVELVSATMKAPQGKRKPGQLMTADECQAAGVLGGDRTRRQNAVDYLCKYYAVTQESNKGKNNGVFYSGDDLQALMLDLAMHGKTPYPGQKWNGDGKA